MDQWKWKVRRALTKNLYRRPFVCMAHIPSKTYWFASERHEVIRDNSTIVKCLRFLRLSKQKFKADKFRFARIRRSWVRIIPVDTEIRASNCARHVKYSNSTPWAIIKKSLKLHPEICSKIDLIRFTVSIETKSWTILLIKNLVRHLSIFYFYFGPVYFLIVELIN